MRKAFAGFVCAAVLLGQTYAVVERMDWYWPFLDYPMYSVLFESTFALAVLIPPLAWIYTLAGTVFHTGIYIVQEAPFFQFVVLYIVFIEPLRRHGPFAWVLRRDRTEGPEGP